MTSAPTIIIDYGSGNLRSVQKAFEAVGEPARLGDDRAAIESAGRLVLPGVGAFGDAAAALRGRGLYEPLRRALSQGRPFLGICLGLQLLFEHSEEGEGEGLGLFTGTVRRFPAHDAQGARLKTPHMGWNTVRIRTDCPLFEGLPEEPSFYFVHSYYAMPNDDGAVLARCHYGVEFAAALGRDRQFAVQFHPEKSQSAGLRVLRNFLNATM